MNHENHPLPASSGHEHRTLRCLPDAEPRVAVVAERLTPGDRHAETVAQLAGRGVPGYAVEVIDPAAARHRLQADRHDLVHLLAGGDGAGALGAASLADSLGAPVFAAHHAGLLTASPPELAGALYRGCDFVLSPTRAADATLAQLGVAAERVIRWQPGVDRERFGPARYRSSAIPGRAGSDPSDRIPFNVLGAGGLEHADSATLLAEAFHRARQREPRLQLVIAGEIPSESELRARLAGAVTFLGVLDADALARTYASADLLVCPDSGDGFGHEVLAAQASGLPVVAIEGSGPAELIELGRNGCVVAGDPVALGDAIRGLARRATLRERLSTGGLMTARERTWERSARALAACWDRARRPVAGEVIRAA
jgi:glycosyltransferase involved in cell wall biosynthesis